MEEKKQSFAPVIIPTLNRYEHLRRCIESLAKCTHAKETELIIGLDYPPSEKYEKGWKMIREYLPTVTGFKKVTILNREHNLGAVVNMDALIEFACQTNDCYIFSEDDNEFSPNFLDFINKGLEKYKDDTHVFSISGYNYPISMEGYDKNVYGTYHFSAWGCGFWRDKRIILTNKEFIKFIFTPSHFFKFLKKSPSHLISLLYMFLKQEIHADASFEIYCCINNWISIFPTVSKVRNWGHDGSGLHGSADPLDDPCYNQEIDPNTSFDFDNIPLKDFSWKPLKQYFKKPFGWYLKKIFQKTVR